MKKRGQAGLEFLMTYGWTLLAAIIVLAAVTQIGITNSSRFVSSFCAVNFPLNCDDFKIDTSGVHFVLKNRAGQDITASTITVDGCQTVTPSDSLIPDGETKRIDLPNCQNLISGSNFKGKIEIDYTKEDTASYSFITTGTISGIVQ